MEVGEYALHIQCAWRIGHHGQNGLGNADFLVQIARRSLLTLRFQLTDGIASTLGWRAAFQNICETQLSEDSIFVVKVGRSVNCSGKDEGCQPARAMPNSTAESKQHENRRNDS